MFARGALGFKPFIWGDRRTKPRAELAGPGSRWERSEASHHQARSVWPQQADPCSPVGGSSCCRTGLLAPRWRLGGARVC